MRKREPRHRSWLGLDEFLPGPETSLARLSVKLRTRDSEQNHTQKRTDLTATACTAVVQGTHLGGFFSPTPSLLEPAHVSSATAHAELGAGGPQLGLGPQCPLPARAPTSLWQGETLVWGLAATPVLAHAGTGLERAKRGPPEVPGRPSHSQPGGAWGPAGARLTLLRSRGSQVGVQGPRDKHTEPRECGKPGRRPCIRSLLGQRAVRV